MVEVDCTANRFTLNLHAPDRAAARRRLKPAAPRWERRACLVEEGELQRIGAFLIRCAKAEHSLKISRRPLGDGKRAIVRLEHIRPDNMPCRIDERQGHPDPPLSHLCNA